MSQILPVLNTFFEAKYDNNEKTMADYVLTRISTSFGKTAPKVILHLQSADTLVHKSIAIQIRNIKKEIPDAEIELVCHVPGLEFLLKEKSQYITNCIR